MTSKHAAPWNVMLLFFFPALMFVVFLPFICQIVQTVYEWHTARPYYRNDFPYTFNAPFVAGPISIIIFAVMVGCMFDEKTLKIVDQYLRFEEGDQKQGAIYVSFWLTVILMLLWYCKEISARWTPTILFCMVFTVVLSYCMHGSKEKSERAASSWSAACPWLRSEFVLWLRKPGLITKAILLTMLAFIVSILVWHGAIDFTENVIYSYVKCKQVCWTLSTPSTSPSVSEWVTKSDGKVHFDAGDGREKFSLTVNKTVTDFLWGCKNATLTSETDKAHWIMECKKDEPCFTFLGNAREELGTEKKFDSTLEQCGKILKPIIEKRKLSEYMTDRRDRHHSFLLFEALIRETYQLSFFECYGSVFSGVLLSLVVGGFFAGAEASRLVTRTKEVYRARVFSSSHEVVFYSLRFDLCARADTIDEQFLLLRKPSRATRVSRRDGRRTRSRLHLLSGL
jgi:hypothetical protein